MCLLFQQLSARRKIQWYKALAGDYVQFQVADVVVDSWLFVTRNSFVAKTGSSDVLHLAFPGSNVPAYLLPFVNIVTSRLAPFLPKTTKSLTFVFHQLNHTHIQITSSCQHHTIGKRSIRANTRQ